MAILTVAQVCKAIVGTRVVIVGYVLIRGTLQVYPLHNNFTIFRILLADQDGNLIEASQFNMNQGLV